MKFSIPFFDGMTEKPIKQRGLMQRKSQSEVEFNHQDVAS